GSDAPEEAGLRDAIAAQRQGLELPRADAADALRARTEYRAGARRVHARPAMARAAGSRRDAHPGDRPGWRAVQALPFSRCAALVGKMAGAALRHLRPYAGARTGSAKMVAGHRYRLRARRGVDRLCVAWP